MHIPYIQIRWGGITSLESFVYLTRIHSLIVALLLSLAVVSGCANNTQPESLEPGQSIVTVLISDVQTDERLPLLDVDQELPAVDTADSAVVKWGGTITRVVNLADEQTLLEIVSRPLRSNGRPVHNDTSEGRFVAYIDKFLDPEIVVSGRDITVVGTLVARQSGLIGETQYVFPVVAAQAISYWKTQTAVRQRFYPHWSPYQRHRSDPFFDFWIFHRRPGFSRR